jgi:hypothetical protein
MENIIAFLDRHYLSFQIPVREKMDVKNVLDARKLVLSFLSDGDSSTSFL